MIASYSTGYYYTNSYSSSSCTDQILSSYGDYFGTCKFRSSTGNSYKYLIDLGILSIPCCILFIINDNVLCFNISLSNNPLLSIISYNCICYDYNSIIIIIILSNRFLINHIILWISILII